MRALSRPFGLLVATLLCLSASILTAPVARADDPTLTVQLTGVSATGSEPSSEVVLSGTVTNTGSVAAYGVQVIFWRSAERIRDVATLTSVTHGGEVPAGSRLVTREANFTKLVTDATSFAPGAAAGFTIRATLAEIGVTTLGAPYVVGVDIRGNADGSSSFQTLARVRTVVPVAGPDTSATAAPLVLFSSTPSNIAGSRFADDHLASELAAGGRLDRLLKAAEEKRLSWVIDPSLFAELTTMSQGYSVVSGETAVDGSGAQAAKDWLARFAELPASLGYRTLYALPDVGTAARLDDPGVLSRALAAAETEDASIAALGLIVLPSDLAADATTVSSLSDTGATAIATRLLSTDATWVQDEVPLLRVSAPDPPTGVSAALGTSLYLAGEAMLLSESGHVQVRVVSSTADVTALDASPSWLQTGHVGDVISQLPSTATPTFTTGTSVSGLPDTTIGQLTTLSGRMDVFAQLAPTAPTATARTQLLARAASSAWVGKEEDRARWLSSATAESTAGLQDGAVVLSASSRFVMSSNVNEFPITVTNTFSYPVVVKVRLTSSNPQRLKVGDSTTITVDPEESRTVNIRPEATANGIATVTAQLSTTQNTPIGTSIDVIVEATQYGIWGWILVAVSGLVLVGSTVASLKKSRGRTRAEEAA
ncbi:DUF6049 family protein [Propionicicella superfundia]|uniref:DUF6049 family protein n=1 Tax=Propionicicella superfundia TaxID=348582 RepID=UPI000403C840|nr:DUF6049 family protein [Propionicicella superfundia]